MGRKKTANMLKVIKGTNQPCRMDKTDFEPVLLKAPSHLNSVAKKFFNDTAALLFRLKISTDGDRTALEVLAEAYAEYRAAKEDVKKNGMTYETHNKLGERCIKPNPCIAISQAAYSRMQAMFSAFGLTPATRSKINILNEEKQDDFTTFLNQSNG